MFVCLFVGIEHFKCNVPMFRSNIQENVDLIKLQRDMKEKATKFEALQVKYINLEEVKYDTLISKPNKVIYIHMCEGCSQSSKSRS